MFRAMITGMRATLFQPYRMRLARSAIISGAPVEEAAPPAEKREEKGGENLQETVEENIQEKTDDYIEEKTKENIQEKTEEQNQEKTEDKPADIPDEMPDEMPEDKPGMPIIDFPEPKDLPPPKYAERPGEPLAIRKQRLIYQSRKRGMLENDLILSTFAAKYLKNMDERLTAQYDRLINGVSNDWDIYYWVTNAKPTPKEHENEIMKMLKDHVSNPKREERLRQPDLHK